MRTPFLVFVIARIEAMANGHLLNRRTGKKYSPRIKDSYSTTIKYIRAYERSGQILFAEDMNNEIWFVAFQNYLIHQPIRHNTISAIVTKIKGLLFQQCKVEEIPFKVQDIQVREEVSTKVYTTTQELSLISGVKLDSKLEQRVRDGYIIACHLGLRYADLRRVMNMSKDYLYEVDKRKYFRLRLQKTGVEVVVPISNTVENILNRRRWKLVLPSNPHFNQVIKRVCRQARITQTVIETYTIGGRVENMKREKCDLISSHTARRSFATNAFLAGIPAMKIRRITGHKTEEAFLRYIRADSLESAMSIIDHPFFNS